MVKLLIVEDKRNLRELYKEEFQKEGFEVFLAEDAGEAIQKTQDHNPEMLVLDMNLPDLDGSAVINNILQMNESPPIIINSAYCSRIDYLNCWGSTTYFIKAATPFELKNKVAEYFSLKQNFNVLLPIGNNGTKQLILFSE